MSALWAPGELAAALGIAGPDFAATGISIDTRTLQKGDLFVALQGERDGHDFVSAAFAKGAAGALVSRDVPGVGPLLVVEDTLAGLNRLAQAARARSGAKIVAVTGSVGKTTTKEMLRGVLGAFGAVHAAEASYNNHIGVPLTLARLPREADFAVFEIGMNHPGEIAPLAGLVRPDVAIITCVDRAHLGLMGSEAVIAAEKASVFSGLSASGAAVLPGETAFLPLLRAHVPEGASQMVFGDALGDARLLKVKSDAQGSDIAAQIGRGKSVKFRLAAPGQHMAMNALAVLTAVDALGLDLDMAASALERFTPYAGRGARRQVTLAGGRRILLLDESYNASGASMRAALRVLALQPGRHVAVLGDMLELGEASRAEHLALLPDVLAAADQLFTCGTWCGTLFELAARLQAGRACG